MKHTRLGLLVIYTFTFIIFINMETTGLERINKSGIYKAQGNRVNKKIIDLYYIPHPDDETLSMGIAIADSVYKGNEVHLILFSHGGDSNSRDRINGVGFCKWHNKYHIPSEEGYKRLTIKKLGRFRVKEFIFAALDLGVQIKNIDICDFYEDKFKETDIKKIVLKYVKMYPNARNNTTSYLDDHKTHKKIGNTLYGLYKSGKIKQVRFFISPSKWENVKGTAISNPKVMKRVVKSISDYSTWKPKESLYAIGYHSAGYLFDVVRKKAVSLYHGPNQ